MPSYILTSLIVACALFMEHVDSTVLSTALPAIAADLNEDPIALKLALTSYLLALAVFIPASGWAADTFGARTIFRWAIFVFTLGSILCGLSSNLSQFVGARVIQGVGGAMMVPVGRLVLLRTVPKSEIVRAMAWLTIPALLGPVMGPPLGGFITTYFHWRWIFWINVPIGVLGFALASRYIENVREDDVWPLDVVGFLLSGFGLSSLIFGLTIIGRGFAPNWVVAGLIVGGALLALAYVRHAGRSPHPIIDLSLLKIPTFAASIYGGYMFRLALGAIPFLLPLMLQVGFGMNAFHSGAITFIGALGSMLMKPTAGPILKKLGFRAVLVGNALLSSVFFAALGFFGPDSSMTLLMGVLLVGGFFRSLQFTALNVIAYADIENQAMSRATSFASVTQQLSLASGVAVGAGALEYMRIGHGGGPLAASDFTPAFLVVAALTALSVVSFLRLSPDAGAEMAGRKPRSEA